MGLEQNTAATYLRTRVMTASREELRLMLLDGAIKFAHQGREGIASKNHEQTFTGISQCRDIVLELLTTIKPEYQPELCEKIKALYTFMYTRLVEAGAERSLAKLDEVIKLLTYERETWVLVMEQVAKERAGNGGLRLAQAGEAAASAGAMPAAPRRALSVEA